MVCVSFYVFRYLAMGEIESAVGELDEMLFIICTLMYGLRCYLPSQVPVCYLFKLAVNCVFSRFMPFVYV